jgi:hypothetical protein
MGVLDDVRKWLNDVPLWKELGTNRIALRPWRRRSERSKTN